MAGVSCSVVRLVDGGERFGFLEVTMEDNGEQSAIMAGIWQILTL